jgi:hypothetical protein
MVLSDESEPPWTTDSETVAHLSLPLSAAENKLAAPPPIAGPLDLHLPLFLDA